MSLTGLISKRLQILSHPDKESTRMRKAPLELVVREYFYNLLLLALVAGLFTLLWGVGRSIYLGMFQGAEIQVLRMLNYLVGRVVSMMFFYLFAGTFGLFIISIIIRVFIKMKYAELLKYVLWSTTPLLLFAWLPYATLPLIIWSAFLFILSVKLRPQQVIKKNSVHQRD